MKRIKIREAAQILGVSEQFIRIGIQQGKLPFGTCIKVNQRWNYVIPRERFEAYVNGKDLIELTKQERKV